MADGFGSSAAGRKGGKARAQVLTPEQRSEIARNAALSRWESQEGPPVATHAGVLTVGDTEIECYVLADGTRIVSTRGMSKALGRAWEGRKGGGKLPSFLGAANIKPFVSNDLLAVLNPIEFKARSSRAAGFRAELLPMVCEAYLKARDANALRSHQLHIAKQAEILMRGFARVGIVALVDEATGFQEVRDRFALQEILDRYLRKEFAAWAKRFPDEFYQEIFRLRGWTWKGMRVNRPQCVAAYTKNLVYARLAPGILKELEAKNPLLSTGHRRAMHHQWLTEDVGHPALAQHLHALLGLMRASDSWNQMLKLVNRAFPKRGDSLQLELFADNEKMD